MIKHDLVHCQEGAHENGWLSYPVPFCYFVVNLYANSVVNQIGIGERLRKRTNECGIHRCRHGDPRRNVDLPLRSCDSHTETARVQCLDLGINCFSVIDEIKLFATLQTVIRVLRYSFPMNTTARYLLGRSHR